MRPDAAAITSRTAASALIRLKRHMLMKWLAPYRWTFREKQIQMLTMHLIQRPLFAKILRSSIYYDGGTYSSLFKLLKM